MSNDLSALTELVVVCGHATFTGTRKDIMSEDHWILQPFQRSNPATGKRGEHEIFIQHVLAANFTVASRPKAFLIFSGGRTTRSSYRTEAEGYEQVHLGLDDPFNIGNRYAKEDYATDSFQNLLFSILRFREIIGRYPRDITVVTHAFKRDRILGVHAKALRWPHDRIRLQGIDPPFTMEECREIVASERRAERQFASDPFGRHPPLCEKRWARNFDSDEVEGAFAELEPEVYDLLMYSNRGDEEELKLPARFPWEKQNGNGE